MESGIHSGLEIARSAIVLRGIRLPVVVDYRSLAAQVGYGSATLHERARLAGVVLIPTVERDHGVHDHKGPRLARFPPRDYPRVIRLWRGCGGSSGRHPPQYRSNRSSRMPRRPNRSTIAEIGFPRSSIRTGVPAALISAAHDRSRVLLPEPESPVKAMSAPRGSSGSCRYSIALATPHSRIVGRPAIAWPVVPPRRLNS